jgi:hypothetical protein
MAQLWMKQEIWRGQFVEIYHLEDRIGLKWAISFFNQYRMCKQNYTGHYLAADSATNIPYTV